MCMLRQGCSLSMLHSMELRVSGQECSGMVSWGPYLPQAVQAMRHPGNGLIHKQVSVQSTPIIHFRPFREESIWGRHIIPTDLGRTSEMGREPGHNHTLMARPETWGLLKTSSWLPRDSGHHLRNWQKATDSWVNGTKKKCQWMFEKWCSFCSEKGLTNPWKFV